MDARKKLEALRARTQVNGCTAHEEEVAQARIAKLLAENPELNQPEQRSEFNDFFEQMMREQRMRQSNHRAAFEEVVRRAAQRAAEEANRTRYEYKARQRQHYTYAEEPKSKPTPKNDNGYNTTRPEFVNQDLYRMAADYINAAVLQNLGMGKGDRLVRAAHTYRFDLRHRLDDKVVRDAFVAAAMDYGYSRNSVNTYWAKAGRLM